MRFHDREQAGRLLAARLEGSRGEQPVILALTSGGIPVAFEVARLLGAPLDLVVVRKIRAPGSREYAVGAIAEGGATFLNPTVLREAGLPYEEAAALAESEVAELARRVRLYRGDRPPPHLSGRTVVVVDDGVVTGASARAAGRAARQRGAKRIVLAAPVVARTAEPELESDFDEVVALETPAHLQAIGDWYERFEEVSDESVLAYLRRAQAGTASEPSELRRRHLTSAGPARASDMLATPRRGGSHPRGHARFIRWFEEITIGDVPLVGGKTASIGEMYRELSTQGVRVPNGFAITAEAYRYVLRTGSVLPEMEKALAGVDKNDLEDLARRGRRLRELVYQTPLPGDLAQEITAAYGEFCAEYGENADVAVRSSATAEDLPGVSFAGQHETYLNVRGTAQLLDACRRCFASLFTDRAISYRIDQGFDHLRVALSIGIMKMIRSDLAASGVIFTLDTETGFRDVVLITASYGLGENVVQGTVSPDEFYVFKPTLREGLRPIIRRKLGEKKIKLIYGSGTSKVLTRNIEVPKAERRRFCIADDEILELARSAVAIERHYSRKAGKDQPMDIEWAKDGLSGQLFIVQARPETVQSQKSLDFLEVYRLEREGTALARGTSVGEKIASGAARVVTDVHRLSEFRPGEILVADSTTPDWEPVMKTAAAIVTNRGGRTCHAAIVSRELGIPSVVGTRNGTERIGTGRPITVSCAEGEIGKVYDEALPFRVERVALGTLGRPRTKIMMNLGTPEEAFALSRIPNDGVGLARMEFIINNHIKIHPMALVHPERVADEEEKRQIEDLTFGYEDKQAFFVEKLAEGIGTIAAAFFPKPVVVRLSDFKTNEYARLLGGKAFEPAEENPMIGFRGASRYYDDRYRDGFALECRALRRVREEMGLANVVPMVPFCRTVTEGQRVLAEMAKNGLKRGENGLHVYVMAEIPNNAILIDEFSRLFDGFSIGSNDLTQLTLGVDRDSALVAHVFDERDAGVKWLVSRVVEGAKRNQRHSGICGQAPSDYPDFAEFLVEAGIDSISLNPDSLLKITLRLLEVEAAGQRRTASAVLAH